MRNIIHPLFALAAFGLSLSSARAHYNMLLPEKQSVKRGEPVTLLYQWGHPFEHQLFDAPAPQKVLVFSPDGKVTDLTTKLENGGGPLRAMANRPIASTGSVSRRSNAAITSSSSRAPRSGWRKSKFSSRTP